MPQNKWIVMIIAIAIVFGLIIVTNAHFNIGVGMGDKTATVSVE